MSRPREDNLEAHADRLFAAHQTALWRWMDQLFMILLLIQWLAGIAAAVWISPLTWSGANASLHFHVPAAVLIVGLITSWPVYLGLRHAGKGLTRHTIAVAQMLTSALLIHLTGGRIETHFHVFGSLAILACYRDWRVLITASAVIAFDHWMRGIIWPESVYGVLFVSSWRFLEHTGWVVFEDIFLILAIRRSTDETRKMARQSAELAMTNQRIDAEVRLRTHELHDAVAAHAQTNRQLESAVVELRAKNRELDEFAYVASHDLQEPIRKLISFSQLLRQDVEGQLNEQAERDIEFITDAALRMRNLVQALLALSRAGRSALRRENVNLEVCVDHALDALELRLQETAAQIVRNPLPQVTGDPTTLTQLYQNLISNGLKFVGQQTPIIHLTAERDGDLWTLGVKDNGIGIKEEFFDTIFEPMRRLHSRSEYEGSGIGLAVCRKTVERYGGRIWVESTPGQGAHFKFILEGDRRQVVPEQEAEQPAEQPTQQAHGNLHGENHHQALVAL